jgi:hypothetical protein
VNCEIRNCGVLVSVANMLRDFKGTGVPYPVHGQLRDMTADNVD